MQINIYKLNIFEKKKQKKFQKDNSDQDTNQNSAFGFLFFVSCTNDKKMRFFS